MFSTDAASLHPERKAAIECAINECAECHTTLQFVTLFGDEDGLDDVASEPDLVTEVNFESIRANFETIASEDREAEVLLADANYLSAPGRAAWKGIDRQKRFQTGGVVRLLTRNANRICEERPLDALTFADTAIAIAETLSDDSYPWNSVFDMRGTAWKERANALLVLGRYPAALDALDSADRAYRRLRSQGFGLSSTALVRASVLYEQEHYADAMTWAERAEHGFAHIGQEDRRMRAVFLRASISYELADYAAAVALFEQVLDYGERSGSAQWIARASYAIGNCEVDRRRLAEASLHLHRALPILRELGPDRDRIATEYALTRVLLHGGRPAEAVPRLQSLAEEYERLAMFSDAALVQLDVIEALLAMGRARDVASTATALIRTFKAAGMSRSVLTALAYMKESHAHGSLTPEVIHVVRKFVRRAESHPDLLFVPPPDALR